MRKPTTTPKRATPSTSAAVRIMFTKMRPPISGWRAVASQAPSKQLMSRNAVANGAVADGARLKPSDHAAVLVALKAAPS